MWLLDKLVEGTDKAVEGIKGFEIYIDTDEIRQKIENSAFGKAIAWIGDKISSLSFENFKKNMVDLWENTTVAWENSTIKAGLDWVGTKISAIPGSIESLKGKITEFWNTVTNWDSGPIHAAWTWVSDKITAIPDAIETLKENITGFFGDFKVAYENSPVYTAVNAVKGAIDSVISAAQSAINWLKELFGVQNSGSPDGIYPQDGSVVYDEPAIAGAVNKRAYVEITESKTDKSILNIYFLFFKLHFVKCFVCTVFDMKKLFMRTSFYDFSLIDYNNFVCILNC